MSTLTGLISSGGGGGGGSEPAWESILPISPNNDPTFRYDGSNLSSTSSTFWSIVNIQGAYITTTNISSYTTIVNVTGTGRFAGVIAGSAAAGNTTNIRLTLDGVVKTYVIPCNYLKRAMLHIPSHYDYSYFSIADGLLLLSASTSNISATAHKNSDNSLAITTGNPRAIYFKESLKVEIQSSAVRTTGSYRNYSGVLYALTD